MNGGYLFSPAEAGDEQTFRNLHQLAEGIVKAARDWKTLEAVKGMARRCGETKPQPCIRLIDAASGERFGSVIVPTGVTIADLTFAIRHKGAQKDAAPRAHVRRHAVLVAFDDLLARAGRRGRGRQLLEGVQVRAQVMEGVGLVAMIDAMPLGHFNEPALLLGPGVERPILSATGEQAFNQLFSLGRSAVAEHLPPGCVFALILSDRAVDDGKAAVQPAEAA